MINLHKGKLWIRRILAALLCMGMLLTDTAFINGRAEEKIMTVSEGVDNEGEDNEGEETQLHLTSMPEPTIQTQDFLPASYTSRELMPPIRNQGSWGTCWAQATTALIEISLIKQGLVDKNSIDLSEAHLIYYVYRPVVDPL